MPSSRLLPIGAGQSGRFGDRRHLARGSDSAAFADVDRKNVGGAGAGERHRILQRVAALVRHHRHRNVAAHVHQPLNIERRDRLLGEIDVRTRRPSAANRLDRDARAPAAVGVDTQAESRSPIASRTARTRAISPSGSIPTFTLSAFKPCSIAHSASLGRSFRLLRRRQTS